MAQENQSIPVLGAGENPPPKAPITRHRSPNYPFIGLQKAIERTRELYDIDRRHPVPITVASEQRWKYKPGGSQADQTVAALKAYGLVDIEGAGTSRKIRVSDSAHRILLSAPESAKLLKAAALSPAINGELWKKYGAEGLPSNDVIRHYLIFERHFNEDIVDSFIANFRATISLAKLDSSDKIGGENTSYGAAGGDSGLGPTIEVGDLIQWESNGQAMFDSPRRVERIAKDSEGSDFVFVEGSSTGMPVEQVRVVPNAKTKEAQKSVNQTSQNNALDLPAPLPALAPPVGQRTSAATIKEYIYTTDTGNVTVRWPSVLSAEDRDAVTAWLDGMKAKISRSADPTANK